MLNQGHGLLEVPEEEAIDIDTPLDFEYAHWRYQRRF
jgi:CMP-N-acetylneuraminic acid synthetase